MNVKICDLKSSTFRKDFIESVINTGFAVIKTHDIEFELIKDSQRSWRNFFLNEQSYKESFTDPSDPNMGYVGFKREKAVGATKPDLKEHFHWKPGKRLPDGTWASTSPIFYSLESLAMLLLPILDEHYQKGSTKFTDACMYTDNTIVRPIYYPAIDFSKESGAVRSAPHEDINFITLLVAASAPGLQAMDKKGQWHDVPYEDNSVIMNVGDMLELASGGLYKSTTHRVINPEDSTKDRVSMPFFVHPHSDTVLADGITAKQFLDKRLKEISLKG